MGDAAMAPLATHPFDALADDYDRSFVTTRLGRWLRAEVCEVLAATFSPGDRVLELGSGTGEDAIWLVERKVAVTGSDASAKMLAIARAKAARAGVDAHLRFHHIDWNGLQAQSPDPGPYDGVLANFGVVNCIRDRQRLATTLAPVLRPGARAVIVMMGPLCLFEIGWRLAHGHLRSAFRRLRQSATARLGDNAELSVWYPSAARLAADFAPRFRLMSVSGLGVLLPPTDLSHLVERWPRFFTRVRDLDRRLSRRRLAARLADHYVAIFERI